MPCQCSSIQFGTVAEVLDRECLKVNDPTADCQDAEEAPEDQVLIKEDLKEIDGLAEADFEEAHEDETAGSCHKLQNGSSPRKTNESVGGTSEEVLTEQDLKEHLNSLKNTPTKCLL